MIRQQNLLIVALTAFIFAFPAYSAASDTGPTPAPVVAADKAPVAAPAVAPPVAAAPVTPVATEPAPVVVKPEPVQTEETQAWWQALLLPILSALGLGILEGSWGGP